MSDIELVIKIPDEIMEYIKNNGCLSVIYIDEVAKAIQNGTPLSEELEKIKAEFEEDKYILLNQTVAIQIIDKHIKELKGEQE